MERLLHERLRDAIDEANSECVEDVDVYVGNAQVSLYLDGAHAIADEIERYYIPRPRFEDGEPVPWASTDIDWGDENSYAFNALNKDGEPMAKCSSEIYAYAEMTNDGFVKRKEEKDTLERIEDDATILPYAYCLEHGIGLSATPDMEEATIAMVHDLLRRQREVLKCDQSS